MTAQRAPGSTDQFVSELSRRVDVPVIVTARQISEDEGGDSGQYYVMQFGIRPGGYLGLERFTIAVDDAGASIGSADMRRVKLGDLSSQALRYLSMSRVDWSTDAAGEVSFLRPAANDWQESYRLGGASEQDASFLPELEMVRDDLTSPLEWRAELRQLGPSNERVAKTVAAVYRWAELNGEPPNKEVERLLGLASSTASHWIKLARQSGELAPARRKPRSESRNHGDD